MMPSSSGETASEPTPEQRLQDLERQVKELKRKTKDPWDKLQSLSGLTGLIVAITVAVLTGSINRSLKEREFQFSSAKDMQQLLAQLNDPKTTVDDKQSAALVLAAFGKYAIQPLIHQLESTESNRSVAAEVGLRAIGYTDPENTCRELLRVLENRTAIFPWYTHLSTIRLLRDTGCGGAAPVLERYQQSLKLPDYRRIVRAEPAPTAESLDELKSAIADALPVLRAAPTDH